MIKFRVQQNWNRKTKEILYGVSVKPEGSRFYCKYPIGHQSYKSKALAARAMFDLLEAVIKNGAKISYGTNGSAGINKSEYVIIE